MDLTVKVKRQNSEGRAIGAGKESTTQINGKEVKYSPRR